MKFKRHLPLLCAGLMLTLLAACASPDTGNACCCTCTRHLQAPGTDATSEEAFPTEKETIRKVLSDQVEAWNAADLDGFMEGYWKSDNLIFTSDGRIRRGWQATLDAYRQNYTKDTMGQLSFSDLDIVLTGDNEAVVLGLWRISEGDRNQSGRFTLVLHRFVEGWRIIRDHTSSD